MKKLILLFTLLIAFTTINKAQLSAGFFSATVSSNISSPGTHAWTLPGGGSLGFTTSIVPGTLTQGLHFHGFGFNIPTAANIIGAEAILTYCVMPTTAGTAILKDTLVRLVVNNMAVGANQGCVHNFTAIVTTHTYGDPANTWGATLTPADVNAATFGFVSHLKSIGTATSFAGVEKSAAQSAKMKIYYVSTTGIVECQTGYAQNYCYSNTLYLNDVYQDTKLEVFNLEGRKVHETIVVKDQSRVDLSKLNPGVYFYRMMFGKKEVIEKILIE